MSRTIKIAIDPGASGAVAVKYPDGQVAVHPFDCESGAVSDMEAILAYDDTCAFHAVLERVHAMPSQGVSSTFKFGTNYGFWRGVLQALRIPFREETPQQWQRGLYIGKCEKSERKKRLKQLAVERYPQLGNQVTLKTADALLMLQQCWA